MEESPEASALVREEIDNRHSQVPLKAQLTLCAGLITSAAPVYHSETRRGIGRGRAVIRELFILDVGWLVAQFVTFGFNYINNGAQWVKLQPN